VPTTIDAIYEAVDGLTEKLADVNADRHLLRMIADAFDADIFDCLIERDHLRQLVIDFRAEQSKPVAKKKGKARVAAKKRKTRSK
jgi:hypothetical protein